MELVFEMRSSKQFVPTEVCRKIFTQAGGVIGRSEDCDWIIPDRKRHLSSHHAMISYQAGAFYLTDTSSNGMQERASGFRLIKGQALQIESGSIYVLGDFEIHAQLRQGSTSVDSEATRPRKPCNLIPDDVFLDLDPLSSVDRQESVYSELDEPGEVDGPLHPVMHRADYARIDRENLTVPQLVDAAAEPVPVTPKAIECQQENFWEHFGAALGVDLQGLDSAGREALALNAARLLSRCVAGLQQSLRTRSELKNELRLAQTTVQGLNANPLKFGVSAGEALGMLLLKKTGQLPAEQALASAFSDLQAHQVAMLAGSRAAVRGALEHCSPQQLTLRFEREHKPLFATAGSRWRAYVRYHQALLQDDDWSARLLTRDFAQAYEEQIHLISTLHTDLQE